MHEVEKYLLDVRPLFPLQFENDIEFFEWTLELN